MFNLKFLCIIFMLIDILCTEIYSYRIFYVPEQCILISFSQIILSKSFFREINVKYLKL